MLLPLCEAKNRQLKLPSSQNYSRSLPSPPYTRRFEGSKQYGFVLVCVLGNCNVFTQPMIVFCTLYFVFFHFPESPSSSLHSIYDILLLITISDDFILFSSAILDTLSTIKHEPALCLTALPPSHSDSLVWVWGRTQYLTETAPWKCGCWISPSTRF